MKQENFYRKNNYRQQKAAAVITAVPQHLLIGGILLVALLAFELFNFDTTRFALRNLLGEVHFLGMHWATILAVAFCAIDFAGLARLFTPQQRGRHSPEAWYLMGAWLLGATMNAVMTWWAVSLTLLSHEFGNEVLTRAQLLRWVPFFIAALVWLTRILFIGALSVAGDYMMAQRGTAVTPGRAAPRPQPTRRAPVREQRTVVTPQAADGAAPAPPPPHHEPATRRPTRIRRRPQPPQPQRPARSQLRPTQVGMQARERR